MPNTDPINIPIKATDTATASLKKVAQEADRTSKKGVKLDVTAPGGGPLGSLVGKAKGIFSNISGAALGAGAAVGAVGKFIGDSVNQFQDLALEVGKFSDATGLSTEQASAFLEVTDDLGISAQNAEKLVGFFNKTIGKTPGILDDYGASIVTAKDGTTDVQATFLNAVDAIQRIEDPAKRSAAATALFGRSWADAAELITTSSGDLKKSFDSVSKQKIITPEELARAREARNNFDALNDAIDDVKLTIGQELAPTIAQLAADLGNLIEVTTNATTSMGDFVGMFDLDNLGRLGKTMGSIGSGLKDVIGFFAASPDSIKKHKDAVKDANGAVTDYDAALSALVRDTFPAYSSEIGVATGQGLEMADSMAGMRQSADDAANSMDSLRKRLNMGKETDQLKAQIGGAMLVVGSGAQVAADDVLTIKQSIIDVGEYAGKTPIEVQSVLDQVDRGEWDTVYNTVNRWAQSSPVTIDVKPKFVNTAIPGSWIRSDSPAVASASAGSSGGVAVAPFAAPSAAAPVTLPAVMHVTVNAGMVADSVTLARALTRGERAASRLMGPRWRQVTAA